MSGGNDQDSLASSEALISPSRYGPSPSPSTSGESNTTQTMVICFRAPSNVRQHPSAPPAKSAATSGNGRTVPVPPSGQKTCGEIETRSPSCHSVIGKLRSCNGRFLRHRFSPKLEVIAIQNSLPKRKHGAKETVSAALQTRSRQRSERICKPNDVPRTKPRPCVKTMLRDRQLRDE